MGPDKKKIMDLEARMAELGIKKSDIQEKFIKAPGRGGQKVNKSSSAVFLKHKPSGLTVKCSKARSQNLNRFLALRSLVDKIEEQISGKTSSGQQKADRLKKQKAKRKKRARQKHITDE